MENRKFFYSKWFRISDHSSFFEGLLLLKLRQTENPNQNNINNNNGPIYWYCRLYFAPQTGKQCDFGDRRVNKNKQHEQNMVDNLIKSDIIIYIFL